MASLARTSFVTLAVALLATAADAQPMSPKVSLHEAYHEGARIRLNDGPVKFRTPGSGTDGLQIASHANGVSLNFLGHGESQWQTFLQPDVDGAGSFFYGSSDDVNPAWVFDGNYIGSSSVYHTLMGRGSSMTFDTLVSGDLSVVLPDDSISSLETGEEAGVAADALNSFITFSGGVDTILSRTITVPKSGYVFAIGTLQLNAVHASPAMSRFQLGVSDTPGVLPSNQDVGYLLNATMPDGSYVIPATVQGLFSVPAGATTFYFLGETLEGSFNANDFQLSLLYFPTAYGQVDPTLASPPSDPNNDHWGHGPPRSELQIRQEQEAERQRFLDELVNRQRELEQELKAHRALVDQLVAQQRGG